MRARTQPQWRGGFEGRGTGYGALVPVQRVQKVPLAHVPDLRRSVQSRAASAQSAQGARLGGCDEVCGESWPDVAECDGKYSASCGSVPNGCAKPSKAKHAFPYKIYFTK